jgi:hypothetical protein
MFTPPLLYVLSVEIIDVVAGLVSIASIRQA